MMKILEAIYSRTSIKVCNKFFTGHDPDLGHTKTARICVIHTNPDIDDGSGCECYVWEVKDDDWIELWHLANKGWPSDLPASQYMVDDSPNR